MTRRPAVPAGRPLVVLDGGPRDRHWYYEDHWVERRRVAGWEMDLRAGAGQGGDDRCPAGDVLRYRETGEVRAHPEPTRFPPGRVWSYRRRPVDE